MHWVEVSRAVGTKDAPLTDHTKRQMEAYGEYYEAASSALRAGATCHDVHRAVSAGFSARGYQLGHVTGHSIGMTMIEFPKIGEGVETELAEDMVFSMHPHAIADSGDCLYMQDTWLVTATGGEPLATPADAALPQVGAAGRREELAGAELPGHEVRGHGEVAAQLLGGRRAVARRAGRQDALVLELALAHDPGALDRQLAVALAVVPGRPDQPHEPVGARGVVEREVEGVVRGARRRPVAALAAERVALERRLRAHDLLRRDPPGGARDRHRLERQTRLVGVAQVVDVELLDARAAVGDVHGEAEGLELAHRLAHRRDARAERARKLLEPQRSPRLELAREDALAQLGRRRIGEGRDARTHIETGCHDRPSYPVDHV